MVQAVDHEAVEGDMDQEAVEGAMDGTSDGRSDRWYKRLITKQSMVQAMDHKAVEGDMDQEAVEGAVDAYAFFDFDFDFCKIFPGFSKKRSGLLPFFCKSQNQNRAQNSSVERPSPHDFFKSRPFRLWQK